MYETKDLTFGRKTHIVWFNKYIIRNVSAIILRRCSFLLPLLFSKFIYYLLTSAVIFFFY